MPNLVGSKPSMEASRMKVLQRGTTIESRCCNDGISQSSVTLLSVFMGHGCPCSHVGIRFTEARAVMRICSVSSPCYAPSEVAVPGLPARRHPQMRCERRDSEAGMSELGEGCQAAKCALQAQQAVCRDVCPLYIWQHGPAKRSACPVHFHLNTQSKHHSGAERSFSFTSSRS